MSLLFMSFYGSWKNYYPVHSAIHWSQREVSLNSTQLLTQTKAFDFEII